MLIPLGNRGVDVFNFDCNLNRIAGRQVLVKGDRAEGLVEATVNIADPQMFDSKGYGRMYRIDLEYIRCCRSYQQYQ